MGAGRLQVINGQVAPAATVVDPECFQVQCVEEFVASWTARGFSEVTIANDVGVLERMLAALGRPAREVTADTHSVSRFLWTFGQLYPFRYLN